MSLLIDGYNLLHALGYVTKEMPPKAFERAREKMLDWLIEKHPRPPEVRVIFDAREALYGDDTERFVRTLRVRYTTGRDADEVIEELIREEPVPARLTVVSDDRRIQIAGKRGGCRVWGSGDLIDWLEAGAPERRSTDATNLAPEKPDVVSQDDLDYWLKEFGEE